jgi:hypothetical protein
MRKFMIVLSNTVFLLISQSVCAECFGEGEYQVCSDSYTDSSGNIHARSWDTQGNNYSVDTESYRSPSGESTIRSYDSEGNNYSIRSWSDSTGVHSSDSEGNQCTITKSGIIIGC